MQRILIVSVLWLGACGSSASQGSSGTFPSASNSDATCKQEVPTGTTFDRKICRSEVQREDERRAARDMALDPRNQRH